MSITAEQLAEEFHTNYEFLAVLHFYKTRKDSAVKWADVPEKNKKLMIDTCQAILNKYTVKEIKK